MILRPYQREAVNGIYDWFQREVGNPLVVLPTAAGKSVIQATFVREAIGYYPSTRIMLVSHVKELLEQNAEKLISLWPEAPVGLYSAGLGRRDMDSQILVAGIQSVHRKAMELGVFDLIIVDECHLIPPSGDGMYRRFMDEQRRINPLVKIIGLTATPYRMKTGLLHEGDDALFDGIAYEVTVRRLIDEGYLCPLISKNGVVKADLSGVGTRGGEFIKDQLAGAMDQSALTKAAIDETMELGKDRNSWLLFCTGVEHAHHVAEEIRNRGMTCATVTGDTPKDERAYILREFKAGNIKAITNCDVLTTGFDAPNIDLLVMLRPTKSTGLYVQIVGRAMRLHPSKKNALILDFSGNIERHGPIDQIRVRGKSTGGGGGVAGAPVKECPECQSLVLIATMVCPDCGHEWEVKAPHAPTASFADILSERFKPKIEELPVGWIDYRLHQKEGKPDSVCVVYTCGIRQYREWVCFSHEGFAQQKACQWFRERSSDEVPENTQEFLERVKDGMRLKTPYALKVNVTPKFPEIVGYVWEFPEGEAPKEFVGEPDNGFTQLDDDIPF